jgi:hypothetical protein
MEGRAPLIEGIPYEESLAESGMMSLGREEHDFNARSATQVQIQTVRAIGSKSSRLWWLLKRKPIRERQNGPSFFFSLPGNA